MRQNFEPKIWGPHAWFFLETVCMAYPTKPTKEEKDAVKNFFLSLKHLIPCEKCRNNYQSHLKIYPLNEKILSSRDNLFMWIVNIHNSVDPNKRRTYDETHKYYMKQYNMNLKNNNNLFIIISLIVIIISIYQIYKMYIKN